MDKKDRVFYLVINEKKYGKFSGEKPIKVAKKIAIKKLNNRIKEIIYYLKEIGGKNKRYGPYHGYKDKNTNKITVSILKKNNIMKGGLREDAIKKTINNYYKILAHQVRYNNPLRSFRIDIIIKMMYDSLQQLYSNLPDLSHAEILALKLNNYCSSSFCSAGVYNYNSENPNFRGKKIKYFRYKNNKYDSNNYIKLYKFLKGKKISKHIDEITALDIFWTDGEYSHFLFIINQGFGKPSIYIFVKPIIVQIDEEQNSEFDFIIDKVKFKENYNEKKEHHIISEIILYETGKENFYNSLIDKINNKDSVIQRSNSESESDLELELKKIYSKYDAIICFKLLNFLEEIDGLNFTKLHDLFVEKLKSNPERKKLKPEDFLEEIKSNKNKYNKCILKKKESWPCQVSYCYNCDKLFPFKNLNPGINQ